MIYFFLVVHCWHLSLAASMTVILGYYGSEELPLGPNCSRLMQANPFFVQSIKVICCLLVYSELSIRSPFCYRIGLMFVFEPGTRNRWVKTRANAIWILRNPSSRCWDCLVWNPQGIYTIEPPQGKDSQTPYFHFASCLGLLIRWIWMTVWSIIFRALQEWEYFLNQGSKVDISYSVKSPSSSPLSLVIAQGKFELANYRSMIRSTNIYLNVWNSTCILQ